MYSVYFLKAKNNKIYVGVTSKNPAERLNEHNLGSNQFTKQNKPFILIYYEQYHCLQDAMLRERYYKTGVGRQIKALIVKYMS
ncbi:GIY-YIG nuclease family protein [Candidatus Collierbacteria bacterium]|nr:GIY-YIG nuclease family protein [Candidatus Collierbacteria bacterium]